MKQILAIDDQQDNLITIKAVLKNFIPDCKVFLALSGAEGIEIANKEKIDTILLDLIMPNMDGFEVCKRLRKNELTKHIPVIMLTAIRTDMDSKLRGLEAGADAFFSKPIEPNELTAQINVMFRIKEAEDKLRLEKKELDGKVQRRTRELEEINEKLKLEIAERRVAEEKSKKTASYLDMMGDGLIVTDLNGIIIKVNKSALKMWGFEIPEEMVGLAFKDIIPQFEYEKLKEIKKYLSEIETKKSIEIIITTKNNIEVPVIVMCSPAQDETGKQVGFISILKDISERKITEEKRLILEKELQQSQKLEAIGTLAAGIAHEINTPIQFIGNNIGFLEKGLPKVFSLIDSYQEIFRNIGESAEKEILEKQIKKLTKKAKLDFLKREIPQAIKQNKEGVDRVATIVKSMKDFSYMGSGVKVEENINTAIESTITIARNEWKYVAEIEKNLQQDLPLVECFIGDIKQVILNLIVNASHTITDFLQESDEKMGLISIATYSKNNFVYITVGDSGKGIPEGIRDKIFEHFFTTKEIGKGTGQGLSMAFQTVEEKHKGKLTFETEMGKGTKFFIKLPIKSEEKEIVNR